MCVSESVSVKVSVGERDSPSVCERKSVLVRLGDIAADTRVASAILPL